MLSDGRAISLCNAIIEFRKKNKEYKIYHKKCEKKPGVHAIPFIPVIMRGALQFLLVWLSPHSLLEVFRLVRFFENNLQTLFAYASMLFPTNPTTPGTSGLTWGNTHLNIMFILFILLLTHPDGDSLAFFGGGEFCYS